MRFLSPVFRVEDVKRADISHVDLTLLSTFYETKWLPGTRYSFAYVSSLLLW